MGAVAVIGEPDLIAGYRLAGARAIPAAEPDAVRAAWHSLGRDTALVIVTATAARSLAAELAAGRPLAVVLPE
ncbi:MULTISPECIES: V-type ATP synthase subunit F [unclassified Nocardia]|uniref:V-type ATP synthase subunit F n=1 Tax=unclassified Nocardia TaxID=2637762 RepID=UPI001CE4927D|nr:MULTISPECIES: V-type ATP synthase subunit F [unclassified Nocardia]